MLAQLGGRELCFCLFLMAMIFTNEACISIGDQNPLGELVGIPDLRKFLGGDIEIDFGNIIPLLKYSSPFGQYKVRYPFELHCDHFDASGTEQCRWRNENTEDGGDELDWVRVKNSWGVEEGVSIFGTDQRATRYSILAGAMETRDPREAAVLVSDPLQCQQGDGQLRFRYWTSPHTVVKVCTRQPGQGRFYEWCSNDISKGDPGPANVVVPGSIMHDFEIVIEASHFDYNAFGYQGGVVILDDIEYNASAIYNCQNVPHVDRVEPLQLKTCDTIECNFFEHEQCFQKLKHTSWRHSDRPTGNLQTGIRNLHNGPFAFVKGSGRKTLSVGAFELHKEVLLEFCAYIATMSARLRVEIQMEDYGKQTIAEVYEDPHMYHQWQCKQLSFVADHLPNDLSYIGLDGIRLLETDQHTSACPRLFFPDDNSTAPPQVPLTEATSAKTANQNNRRNTPPGHISTNPTHNGAQPHLELIDNEESKRRSVTASTRAEDRYTLGKTEEAPESLFTTFWETTTKRSYPTSTLPTPSTYPPSETSGLTQSVLDSYLSSTSEYSYTREHARKQLRTFSTGPAAELLTTAVTSAGVVSDISKDLNIVLEPQATWKTSPNFATRVEKVANGGLDLTKNSLTLINVSTSEVTILLPNTSTPFTSNNTRNSSVPNNMTTSSETSQTVEVGNVANTNISVNTRAIETNDITPSESSHTMLFSHKENTFNYKAAYNDPDIEPQSSAAYSHRWVKSAGRTATFMNPAGMFH